MPLAAHLGALRLPAEALATPSSRLEPLMGLNVGVLLGALTLLLLGLWLGTA